jgi:hypothetical protein
MGPSNAPIRHDLPRISAAIGRQNGIRGTHETRVEEDMPTTTGALPGQEERQSAERRPETNNLTVRYGKIGIPAVAAALRYTDAAKNPAYAPVVPRVNSKLIEMAA